MRRLSLMVALAGVLAGTAVYVNSLVMITVYSSAVPASHVQITPAPNPTSAIVEQKVADRPLEQIVVAKAQSVKQRTQPAAITGNSLSIASIGFQGSILDVGLTANNAIDVPASGVGRYVGSAQPGQLGAVFLDGHVDGVFARLNRLAVGQIVSMSYAGQTLTYRVVFTEIVPLAGIDMNRSLSVYGGANEGLNIMTCAGTYIPSAGTYDKRLVVYTVRVI